MFFNYHSSRKLFLLYLFFWITDAVDDQKPKMILLISYPNSGLSVMGEFLSSNLKAALFYEPEVLLFLDQVYPENRDLWKKNIPRQRKTKLILRTIPGRNPPLWVYETVEIEHENEPHVEFRQDTSDSFEKVMKNLTEEKMVRPQPEPQYQYEGNFSDMNSTFNETKFSEEIGLLLKKIFLCDNSTITRLLWDEKLGAIYRKAGILNRSSMRLNYQNGRLICDRMGIRIISTTHVRMHQILHSLPQLPIKIVHLTRDPRKIVESWIQKDMKPPLNIAQLCESMQNDFEIGHSLTKLQYYLVRQEDFKQKPLEIGKEIYKFLQIQWEKRSQEFVETLMTQTSDESFYNPVTEKNAVPSVNELKQKENKNTFKEIEKEKYFAIQDAEKICKLIIQNLKYDELDKTNV